MPMFCTLLVSTKKWIGIGKETGTRKIRNDNHPEEGDGKKGGVRDTKKKVGPHSQKQQSPEEEPNVISV